MGDNRALVEDTSASIREICAELRPPALDYAGLLPAIESYANLFARRTGIAIQINNTGHEEKLTPEIKSNLFRIVQEALTNVAKHAEASMINIELALDGPLLRLSVSDDGSGFELARLDSHGLGIINMREMAEFSGGSFYLASTPGGGTRISVELPIAEKPV
jgi:two-component system CheB/CheR fusion protein